MLAAGDEMGRTQLGNNNAYCQDNELSWVDWERGAKHADLLEFACRLSRLRRRHPVFRRRHFFSGQSAARPDGAAAGLRDIVWLTPAGREMTDGDWQTDYARSLAVFLNGHAITAPGPRGEAVLDDDFLLLVNAYGGPVTFMLPDARFAAVWEILVDTSAAGSEGAAGSGRAAGSEGGTGSRIAAGGGVDLPGHAMMVLRGSRPAGQLLPAR
jgi:glycogen operon protein